MTEWTHCPHCGTTLDRGATSCRHCGAATPTAETEISGEGPVDTTPPDLEALTAELREALTPNILLLRKLGEGGMGTVFLGREPGLKRLVVIKVLSPALAHDASARARFAREAEAAAAVSHPNIVNVYQVGELATSGTSYFVMQFVDGPTLRDEFPGGTAAPEPQAKRLVGEIAAALAAAHKRGLVHRDIKPANIMLERESGRAIVLDFGISAAISPDVFTGSPTLTEEGTSIGTPAYMSPEQATGDAITDKSDVYNLCLVAFELVVGEPAFKGDSAMDLIAAHLRDTAPAIRSLRPDLDPAFADLITRCLAKDPSDRPSADQIARTLGVARQSLVEWPPILNWWNSPWMRPMQILSILTRSSFRISITLELQSLAHSM